MKKNSRRNGSQRKVLTIMCVVLAVILGVEIIVVLVDLNADKTPDNQVPGTTLDSVSNTTGETVQDKKLQILSVSEEENDVVLLTTYGTVKYPYAFSELLCVEAESFEEHSVLEFGVMIDGAMFNLYTLIFNGAEGFPVGTLQVDGDTYTVTALIHEVSGVSDDSMVTFYAVQETFNDVVNSLSENEGFTATD